MSLVRLSGHLTPGVGARPLHRLPPERPIRLCFVCDDPMRGPSVSLIAALGAHLRQHGLDVRRSDEDAGIVDALGPAAAVERALSITLLETDDGGYQPDDEPALPRAIAMGVAAIIGLSAHPQTLHRPHPVFPLGEALSPGYRPQEIASAYGIDQLPPVKAGALAVILEFASGYSQADLDMFTSAMQLPPVQPVLHEVDGGANDGGTSPVDLEATLDIEWFWAIAPGCELHVIEAPAGSDDGSFGLHLVHALEEAMALQPDVVSVSYGDAESRFPPAVLQAIDGMIVRMQKAGTDVFIASGDQGAYGLHDPYGRPIRHADAPASCPHAIAVGGTHLTFDQNGQPVETGWTDVGGNGAGGGGFSVVFPATAVQLPFLPAGATGRGLPDFALDADPLTGYTVVFEGSEQVVGGTSVAAPVAAAGALRLRAVAPGTLLWNVVYSLSPDCYRDIVKGDNTYGGVPGYQCGPGWDPVTGRGAPLFGRILAALQIQP